MDIDKASRDVVAAFAAADALGARVEALDAAVAAIERRLNAAGAFVEATARWVKAADGDNVRVEWRSPDCVMLADPKRAAPPFMVVIARGGGTYDRRRPWAESAVRDRIAVAAEVPRLMKNLADAIGDASGLVAAALEALGVVAEGEGPDARG